MTVWQTVVGALVTLAIALAVAGLSIRGHARYCRAFTAYLVFVLVTDLLVMSWPDRFWTWPFWFFQQTMADVLKIVVALELAYWIFLGFPGAARSARGVLLLLLVATLLAVVALPNEASRDTRGYLIGSLRPRLQIGALWVFTALAGLVRWYRVPLHPMHRTIILGFVAYLTIFGTFLHLVADYGWSRHVETAEPIAYLAACSWWAWEGWRREPALDADAAVVARLQPWRVPC